MHLLVIEKGGKILLWQRPADSQRLAGFLGASRARTSAGRDGFMARPGGFRHTIVNTTYLVQVWLAGYGGSSASEAAFNGWRRAMSQGFTSKYYGEESIELAELTKSTHVSLR